MGDLLPVAPGVVLALPLTEETAGMIDAGAISRKRTGAVVVDASRGGVLDEAALELEVAGLELDDPETMLTLPGGADAADGVRDPSR